MELKVDDDGVQTLYDAMVTIFLILPEKQRDDFVAMITENYELYTLDQACEALADAKSI